MLGCAYSDSGADFAHTQPAVHRVLHHRNKLLIQRILAARASMGMRPRFTAAPNIPDRFVTLTQTAADLSQRRSRNIASSANARRTPLADLRRSQLST